MKINLQVDKDQFFDLSKTLKGFEGQIPFAMALGLTRLAQKVKDREVQAMERIFDRPSPFTLRSLALRRATKREPQAAIWIKEPVDGREHYLAAQIFGGPRELKGFEKSTIKRGHVDSFKFLMPGRSLRLNKYGNVSRAKVYKISRSLNEKTGGGGLKLNRGYFSINRTNNGVRTKGIYLRLKKKIKPVFISVDQPQYRSRFNFFNIATRTLQKNWEYEMREAAFEALNTRR